MQSNTKMIQIKNEKQRLINQEKQRLKIEKKKKFAIKTDEVDSSSAAVILQSWMDSRTIN